MPCNKCLSDYQQAMAFFGNLYKRNMILEKEIVELREENRRLLDLIEKWEV